MKGHFAISCMLAATLTISSGQLFANETTSLFQRYLATSEVQDIEDQPVYLRNSSREKAPSYTDLTILNVDLPSIMKIQDVAERVLYGDADVVHLRNISAQSASHLYENLKQNYAHFIHVPNKDSGMFIASKYPLSEAAVSQLDQEELEFVIQGANRFHTRVRSHDVSMQVSSSNEKDDNTTSSILLADLPVTLTVVKQQFSPLQIVQRADQIATDTFHILPVRDRDRDRGGKDNDRGGGYYEARVDVGVDSEGNVSWSASGHAGYQDGRGNYVEGDVRTNDRGESNYGVGYGNDKDRAE